MNIQLQVVLYSIFCQVVRLRKPLLKGNAPGGCDFSPTSQ
jgi:hypothetical protein